MRKIRLNKTTKIIGAISIILLSVVLGYLIWKLNQESQLGPGDSDAGSCASIPNQGSTGPEGSPCDASNCGGPCGEYTFKCGNLCYKASCGASACSSGEVEDCGSEPKDYAFNKVPTRIGPFPKTGKVVLFYKSLLGADYRPKITLKGSDGVSKEYKMPAVDANNRSKLVTDTIVYAGDYAYLTKSDDDLNQGDPYCEPGDPKYISWGWIAPNSNSTCGSGLAGPPQGFIPTVKKDIASDLAWQASNGNEIVANGKQCWADWRDFPGDYDFNDYFLMVSYEESTQPVTNTCGDTLYTSNLWKKKPESVGYGDPVVLEFDAYDSDGIDQNSFVITYKLTTDTSKGTTISKCSSSLTTNCYTLSESGTTTKVSITLNNSSQKLGSGTYNINASWKDKLGASGQLCATTEEFTILEENTNPNWSLSKTGTSVCASNNESATVTYTITVKNTGNAVGQITKIEDTLDSKVTGATEITTPGIYSNGKITWSFASLLSINAGETRTYTYIVNVNKDKFGTYSNTVILTPNGSDPINAATNISVSCTTASTPETPVTPTTPTGTVPQTGIFDTTTSKVIVGLILISLGAIVYNAPNINIKKKENYKYRERFEKRVAHH